MTDGEEDAEGRADDVRMEAEIEGVLGGLRGGVEVNSKWSREAFRCLDELIYR